MIDLTSINQLYNLVALEQVMMTSRGRFTTQLQELITQQCGKQLLEKISMPALNTLGLKLNEKSYPFHHPLTVLFHN